MPSHTIPDRPDPYHRPIYDYATAAEYLGLSLRQVKRAAESGKLGRTKLGGLHVRFTQAQLDTYVEACTIAPTTGTTGGVDNA